MKIVVADSSALILLTKIDLIHEVIKQMEVFIPQSVCHEVRGGPSPAYHWDSGVIEKLVQERKIIVKDVKGHSELPLSLGKGEEDAILLFSEIQADLLLCDDGKALKVCRHLKIPFIISPRLVVDFFKKGWIELKKAIDGLEQLSEIGRYSPDIIARAFLELKEAK